MPQDIKSHTTIDSELAHYRALAEQWWDPAGPFWPLHALNTLRMQWIVQQLQRRAPPDCAAGQALAGLSVLDIGCGGGILSEALAAHGATVHAVDVVERNIAIAREHSKSSGLRIHYELIDAESLVQRTTRYDVVFNMEVVEHVARFDRFMDTCCTLVRPGGHMFVATINRNLAALIIAIVGAEYVLRWLPRGTHQYRRLRKPGEVSTALDRNGFSVEARSGLGVNPLAKTLYLRTSEAVNYMVVARKVDETGRC